MQKVQIVLASVFTKDFCLEPFLSVARVLRHNVVVQLVLELRARLFFGSGFLLTFRFGRLFLAFRFVRLFVFVSSQVDSVKDLVDFGETFVAKQLAGLFWIFATLLWVAIGKLAQ